MVNFVVLVYCFGYINNNGYNVRIEFVSGNQVLCNFVFYVVNSGIYFGVDIIYIIVIGCWFWGNFNENFV